jgi:hypothetical protein
MNPRSIPLFNTNYAGHFASPDLLPAEGVDKPSWAFVGQLDAAVPYMFYVPPYVPSGFSEGWNDMSSLLGTYDLTANVISLFDRFLLTEYNVSNNHTQDAYVYFPVWRRIPYQVGFATHVDGSRYRRGALVNVDGFTLWSFQARCDTVDPPVVMRLGTDRFSLDTAVTACPLEYRRLGMKLTFVSVYTAQSETWVFVGSTLALWTDLTYWRRINFLAEPNEVTSRPFSEESFLLPELVADRAVADALGRDIASTYLTRSEAAEFVKGLIPSS